MNNPFVKIILGIVVVVLVYFLYNTIQEPIRYQAEVERRESAIIERLNHVKNAQLSYRDIHGNFAAGWDQLIDAVKNDQLKILSITGDPEDSTSVVKVDTIFISVMDQYFKNVDVDSLRFVPLSETGDTFLLTAGSIKKNNVTVPVFQVTDPKPFNKKRVKDNNPLRLGNMFEPVYTGNW